MSDKLKKLTDWEKLEELLKKKQKKESMLAVDETAMFEHLRGRVKGQDAVLKDVCRLVSLQCAKQNSERPLANMIFLGPTGTGKTELAKAIAEFLYEDEKNMVRFDCSEFSGDEAKTRLVGVPTGYVGAEQGGQLTRPVLANPKRVILFDEIEKSHPSVFDLFLQLMGEGRLTEQGSGKVVDFTKTIIILTSNAQHEGIAAIKRQQKDYFAMVDALKGFLADTKTFRPEIMGRIDRVYVFDPLQGMVVAEIALLKIKKLAESYGLEVDFVDPELVIKALSENDKVSRFGIRELERILFEFFAPHLAAARKDGADKVTFDVDANGQIVCKKSG